MEKITVENNNCRCILCLKTTIDEVRLGPMYRRDGVVGHYFCILFSSGLPQNGVSDNDGILGFLPSDIMKEVHRVKLTRLKCVFCKSKNAFVGCSVKTCRRIWHFECGSENGIHHQFFGKYEAFCSKHSNLPRTIGQHSGRNLRGRTCPICFSGFQRGDSPVFGSCCKSSYFHRRCVQEYALSSGSLFKCPTCSKRSFQRDAEWQGVFVPEKDASWELEPNAFQDLSRRRLRCDCNQCLCPQGRKFRDIHTEGQWYIVRCVLCGGTATHVECGQVNDIVKWACGTCKSVALPIPRNNRGQIDNYSGGTDDSSDSDDDLFQPINVKRKRNVSGKGVTKKS
ncbi:unnamed protein product [Orchesella dallaii]|uniref:PHD finger protein 7 n=1 Tax=Orchesella dallaii TaxID=48710 RepID=A0ABP1Q5Q2_9HEXA